MPYSFKHPVQAPFFHEMIMPRNAKNLDNPYSHAIDAISKYGLLIILEYISHKGGLSYLNSLSIGKMPGLLDVVYYLNHELMAERINKNVFDFFHVDLNDLEVDPFEKMENQEYLQVNIDLLCDDPSSAQLHISPIQRPWSAPILGNEYTTPMTMAQTDATAWSGIAPHDTASLEITVCLDEEPAEAEGPGFAARLLETAAWAIPTAACIYCACTAPEDILAQIIGSSTHQPPS